MCNRPDASQTDALLSVSHHTTATSLYQQASNFLEFQELNLHTIYSHVMTQLTIEQHHASTSQPQQPLLPSSYFAVWSAHPQQPRNRTLDLLLCLSTGPLGPQPLFIGSPHHSSTLTSAFLKSRMSHLVCALLDHIPVERVFSVFGPKRLTQAFTTQWSQATHVSPVDAPYLSATYRVCTANTLTPPTRTQQGDLVRLATRDDIAAVSDLLLARSTECGPYFLNATRARQEADALIRSGVLFVYETRTRVIASILAVERSTANVSCITKLFTPVHLRNNGYASAMLHCISRSLLQSQGKHAVALYLPNDAPEAERVASRVGFVDASSLSYRGERDWLEQGFLDTNLGHW